MLAVLTADCLPVLLCRRDGSAVAAVHAGWRGLAAGVIENTVAALGGEGDGLLAWLGPCIGFDVFEVGDEVRAAFLDVDERAAAAFRPSPQGRWLADLHALARQRLAALGINDVHAASNCCTHTQAERFFSYRRDPRCGRMASLIWLEPPRPDC